MSGRIQRPKNRRRKQPDKAYWVRRVADDMAAVQAPQWATEIKFLDDRAWRFDFGWPRSMVALEVEGIFYRDSQGKSRHQTGIGFSEDCNKYNAAQVAGWIVLRVTQLHIKAGLHLVWVEAALRARGYVEPFKRGKNSLSGAVVGSAEKDPRACAELAGRLSKRIPSVRRKPRKSGRSAPNSRSTRP